MIIRSESIFLVICKSKWWICFRECLARADASGFLFLHYFCLWQFGYLSRFFVFPVYMVIFLCIKHWLLFWKTLFTCIVWFMRNYNFMLFQNFINNFSGTTNLWYCHVFQVFFLLFIIACVFKWLVQRKLMDNFLLWIWFWSHLGFLVCLYREQVEWQDRLSLSHGFFITY